MREKDFPPKIKVPDGGGLVFMLYGYLLVIVGAIVILAIVTIALVIAGFKYLALFGAVCVGVGLALANEGGKRLKKAKLEEKSSKAA